MSLTGVAGWTSRVLINSTALQHNLKIAYQCAPNSKVLAVIKSNGYGHGISEIATALSDADGFAVATLQEAIQVRDLYSEKPIIVLQGFLNNDELSLFKKLKLHPVIHSNFQIDLLVAAKDEALNADTSYWFKFDSGMGRLGFSIDEFTDSLNRLEKVLEATGAKKNIILMSHFANADDVEDDATNLQLNLFNKITADYNYSKTLANSAGILAWQDSHFDWVRAGIMLYGVSPFNTYNKPDNLTPVMTLESRLIAVNQHKKGDTIGYGGGWTCSDDKTIGIVSIGYGDGYPRHATTGTPVLVNGQKTNIVGRVSMDMICIDLSLVSNVEPGAIVTLWGKDLPIELIAEFSNTIAYELLCKVGKRVEFIYQ